VSALFAALSSGILLVPAVRAIALRRGLVAHPRMDRWHRKPTALLGGLAIWSAVLAGIAPIAPLDNGLLALLGAATFLFAVGVLDDFLEIRPSTKLVAQIVAAAIAVGAGFKLTFFQHDLLNLAASFFWIVAVTNAVNLLDNMDGLAAGVVLIAAAYLGWSYAGSEDLARSGMTLALVGALAAFLVFNFNPASIFMGDSGSMFIGFLLAALSLKPREASSVLSLVAVPAVTLLVPILDTALVSVTRLARGRSVAEGGRDHTSHRLVQLGLSEREAVSLLWLLAVIAGACAVLTERYSYRVGLALLPLIIVGFGLLGIYLSSLSFVSHPLGEETAEKKGFVRLALELSFKRRILEVLLDLVLIVACYSLAYQLRFEFDVPGPFWDRFIESLPLVVACTMATFLYLGVYSGVWTFISTEDLLRYVRACGLAVLSSLAAVIVLYRFEGYPRSVLPLYGMLLYLGVAGTRVSFRLMDDTLHRRRPGRNVLIAGAGSGGEIAVREVLRNEALGLRVIGFVDDDPMKYGRRIHGYPVLGATADLERIYGRASFEEVLVSSSKFSDRSLDRIRTFCGARSLPVRFFRIELWAEEGIRREGRRIGLRG
jgi:UDP-GlcNAc:undecaprenyl-phosphate GlcNAc-1-phosphate transferase